MSSGEVESYRTAANGLFDKWRALSMVVEHSFGGQYSSEKAEWLKTVTCEFITNHQSAPDTHEVEDFLSSLMDQEFDTILEDGSVPELSRKLVDLWHKWKVKGEILPADQSSSTTNQINQEKAKAQPQKMETNLVIKGTSLEEVNDILEGTSLEERNDIVEEKEEEEEEEGWTVVSRKK